MAANDELPIVPEDATDLTLEDVCRVCSVQTDFIVELVEEGALAPAGEGPPLWRFTYTHVRRVRVASHLHHDLGINPAGAALALELLEQIEDLQARIRALGGE